MPSTKRGTTTAALIGVRGKASNNVRGRGSTRGRKSSQSNLYAPERRDPIDTSSSDIEVVEDSREHQSEELAHTDEETTPSKCPSVETTNEEDGTEGLDQEEDDMSTQEDVEEAIPEGSKPISKTKLNIWPEFRQHFWKDWHKTATGKVFARCKLCGRVRSARLDAMSNFNRHTRNLHKDEHDAFYKKESLKHGKQKSMQHYVKPKFGKANQSEMDTLLADMIIQDNPPLNVVKRLGFCAFIKVKK